MNGATAFPYLKLRLSPKKGSALFWFTLTPMGKTEYGTRFTQCPVTHKSKWIATKNIFIQDLPLRYIEDITRSEMTLEDYDEKFY